MVRDTDFFTGVHNVLLDELLNFFKKRRKATVESLQDFLDGGASGGVPLLCRTAVHPTRRVRADDSLTCIADFI